MNSTTRITPTPLRRPLVRLGVLGGLVLAALVPAAAAHADDPYPLPGLDDHPVVTAPGGPIQVVPPQVPIHPEVLGGGSGGGNSGTGGSGTGGSGTGGQPAPTGQGDGTTGPVEGGAGGGFAPVAVADAYQTTEGEAIDIAVAEGVLANDLGVDMIAEYLEQPADGAVQLLPDGSFRYEPADGFSGTDAFDYRIVDGDGRVSEPVTVTIEVAPAPEEAVAAPAPTGLLTGLGLGVAALALLVVGGTVFLRTRPPRGRTRPVAV